jgi:hypothetical protein
VPSRAPAKPIDEQTLFSLDEGPTLAEGLGLRVVLQVVLLGSRGEDLLPHPTIDCLDATLPRTLAIADHSIG